MRTYFTSAQKMSIHSIRLRRQYYRSCAQGMAKTNALCSHSWLDPIPLPFRSFLPQSKAPLELSHPAFVSIVFTTSSLNRHRQWFLPLQQLRGGWRSRHVFETQRDLLTVNFGYSKQSPS